jgi:probable addiction module antidote protein
MAWDLAVIRPGDTPYGTRRMRMAAAPIPLRAEARAGFTASRRNEPGELILAHLVAAALGDIARAKGMSQIARETGLGRESLYKALSPDGNPEFSTVLKVVRDLGLRLHAAADV